jgi:hypothetical protein
MRPDSVVVPAKLDQKVVYLFDRMIAFGSAEIAQSLDPKRPTPSLGEFICFSPIRYALTNNVLRGDSFDSFLNWQTILCAASFSSRRFTET